MKRLRILALLLTLMLLVGCGTEPAPISLTPLSEPPASTDAAEERVTIRTASGTAIPAVLPSPSPTPDPKEARLYVLNESSKRFHLPECSSVGDMKPSNRRDVTASHEALIDAGYAPCGNCKP